MTAEPLGWTCDFVPAASSGFGVRFQCEFLASITNDSSPVERERSTIDVAFKESPPHGQCIMPRIAAPASGPGVSKQRVVRSAVHSSQNTSPTGRLWR